MVSMRRHVLKEKKRKEWLCCVELLLINSFWRFVRPFWILNEMEEKSVFFSSLFRPFYGIHGCVWCLCRFLQGPHFRGYEPCPLHLRALLCNVRGCRALKDTWKYFRSLISVTSRAAWVWSVRTTKTYLTLPKSISEQNLRELERVRVRALSFASEASLHHFVRFDIGKVNRWPLSPPALLGFVLSEQTRCIWHSRVASLWVFASLFFPFPISS